MKRVLYSSLTTALAIGSVLISKASSIFHNRNASYYEYIGLYPVNSASQVTNVSNWTLVTTLPSCADVIQACSVETTIPATTVFGRRPSSKIPATQTVTGINPRFTARKMSGTGITLVHSKANQ